jgi:hypothetical protein
MWIRYYVFMHNFEEQKQNVISCFMLETSEKNEYEKQRLNFTVLWKAKTWY